VGDFILRISTNGGALAFIATTANTVGRAAKIHGGTPVVSAALGRLLTAAAIMGASLKNDGDLLTLNIKGDGPIGGIVATSDRFSRVKGYPINRDADLPLKPNGKLDISGALGNGHLHVIKDLGLKEPYIGTAPLVSGEIAEDLVNYFAVSEQTPSAIGLGVLVDRDYTIKSAGGFFIQLLPNADDQTISALERVLGGFDSVTSFYDGGKTPYDMADHFFAGIGYRITDVLPVSYHCNCGRQRAEKALVSLGAEELEKIIAEDKKATLHCHFCRSDYDFDEGDLNSLLREIKK